MVCVSNDDYSASLEVRKIYELVSDPGAEVLGMLRVIDESGEDYLYPGERFLPIVVPAAIARLIERDR